MASCYEIPNYNKSQIFVKSSLHPVFVKGYRFLSFAKNMGRNIGKNISKNLSSKYSQKLLDHAKQSVTDIIKPASKRVTQKTAESNW